MLKFEVTHVPDDFHARFTPGDEILVCVGTPEYLAPEVWTGRYPEKADIFAAGVLGYLCLESKYPELSGCRRGGQRAPSSALEATRCGPFGRPGPGASFLPCSQVRKFEYELTERILFGGIWASSGAFIMISKVHTWQLDRRVRGNAGVPRPEVRSTQKRLLFFRRTFAVPLQSVQTRTSSKVSHAEEVPLGMLRLFCTTRAKALMRHSCHSATLLSQE